MGVWTEGKLAEPRDLGSRVLESPNLSAPTICSLIYNTSDNIEKALRRFRLEVR